MSLIQFTTHLQVAEGCISIGDSQFKTRRTDFEFIICQC